MKRFKIIDFWINTGLIISFIIVAILEKGRNFMATYFLAGYFIVGGWQVISMIVHLVARCFIYKGGKRYWYNWITLIAVSTMPGSFWALLYVAPFMAVYYAYICYRETYVMMQRPLALLK